jgi:hypothetical protein
LSLCVPQLEISTFFSGSARKQEKVLDNPLIKKIQSSFNRPTTKITKRILIMLGFIHISFQEKRRVELQNPQLQPSIPPTGSMNTSPHFPRPLLRFDPKYQDRRRRDNINL